MIPVLLTERLVLRGPEPGDLEPLAAFYATDRSRYVGGPLPRDRVWRGIAADLGHWQIRGYGRWAVVEKATGAYVGEVGLWFPEGWFAREVAWLLVSPEHEGRGLAREAALAARAHAYGTLGWTDAFSVIDPENARSVALARRLGCTVDRHETYEGRGIDIWRHPAPRAAA
jgi:RimJ/RimL family protein N-acetyltransferase